MLGPKPHGRSPCLPSSGVVRQSRDGFRHVASLVDDVGDCQKSLESVLSDRRESDFRHEETGECFAAGERFSIAKRALNL